MEVKFSGNQLSDLNERFTESKKAVPIIVQRLLVLKLREKRNALRGSIPTASGRLRRSFGTSVRRNRAIVTAVLGFMRKRTTAGTAIAANVLQKPGASPKKGRFLAIPLPANRNADGSPINTPRQVIDTGGFVKRSKAGNMILFRRAGKEIEPMFLLKTHIQFGAAPLPIEEAGEQAAKDVARDLPTAIAAILEAKNKAVEALG